MKIISLNTWGGKVYAPLMDFLAAKRDDVDVFCFQEVFKDGLSLKDPTPGGRDNLFADLQAALSDHDGSLELPEGNAKGLAMFIRKTLGVVARGCVVILPEVTMMNNRTRIILQHARIKSGATEYLIANFHGLWTPEGKGDTSLRLEQSEKLKAFLDATPGAKILAGDFNLLPATESLRMLEAGMRNLITEAGATSTRSYYYSKAEKFADYVFVSPEVEVKSFAVLPDVVSDHLPLMIEVA